MTLWFEARYEAGELATSSDEVDDAGWFRRDALPEPLFLSFRNYLEGRFLR